MTIIAQRLGSGSDRSWNGWSMFWATYARMAAGRRPSSGWWALARSTKAAKRLQRSRRVHARSTSRWMADGLMTSAGFAGESAGRARLGSTKTNLRDEDARRDA